MTDQEKFNAELQMKTNLQEAKFNMLVAELKEQRQDIRDLNKKLDEKFDKLSAQIQNLTIAAIVGIGAIVLGGGAIVWAAITSLR